MFGKVLDTLRTNRWDNYVNNKDIELDSAYTCKDSKKTTNQSLKHGTFVSAVAWISLISICLEDVYNTRFQNIWNLFILEFKQNLTYIFSEFIPP